MDQKGLEDFGRVEYPVSLNVFVKFFKDFTLTELNYTRLVDKIMGNWENVFFFETHIYSYQINLSVSSCVH